MVHAAIGYACRLHIQFAGGMGACNMPASNACLCYFTNRGVGCIFFEMACGRPMFPGSTVEEELMLQWKVKTMATPTIH